MKENSKDAAKDIVEKLIEKYNIDYCSIFSYEEKDNKLSILSSNVLGKYHKSLTAYVCNIDSEVVEKNHSGKIIFNENGLDYPTAMNRNIKYIYYIPLQLGSNRVGSILIENTKNINKNEFVIDFFKLVLENISISIQHLMFFEKIIQSGQIDGLTQVFNRGYFNSFILNVKEDDYFIVLMDIDFFKKVNDTYGHQVGDLVLIKVAETLKSNLESDDILARYGGEEFIIYTKGNELSVFRKIEKIRELINNLKIEAEGICFNISCSFGICGCIDKDINVTIKSADKALYISKTSGRNRTTVFRGENKNDGILN